MKTKEISRRKFIRNATLMAAGAYVLPRFAIGREGGSANGKISVAAIGCQGQAGVILWSTSQQEAAQIVGLCDVDAHKLANPCRIDPSEQRPQGRPALEAPDARRYADFREMLHDLGDKVDAVLIGTPDHAHFPAAMMAMSLGKHVYCEKPLANELWCVRQMQDLARRAGVVTQMGIQSHANDGIRLAKEWYEAGVIGEAKEIHIWTDRPLWPGGLTAYPEPAPVRAGLNWDLWLSYQKERPYAEGFEPFMFRTWWDFGAGALGDIACHSMDIPNYVFELPMPSRVEVVLTENNTEISTPTASTLRYHFPAGRNHGPLVLTWYDGHFLSDDARRLADHRKISVWSESAGRFRVQNMPKPPPGWPEGKPLAANGQFIVGDKGFLYNPSMHVTTPEVYPGARWAEFRSKLPPRSEPRNRGGHIKEWLEAIGQGKPQAARANFDYSAPLTEKVLLGKLALRSGRDVIWDSANLRAIGNDPANKFIKPDIRDGWLFGL